MATDIRTDREIRASANKFYGKWNNRGKEKQDDQSYWNDIFTDILGIYKPSDHIQPQKEVYVDGNKKWIDLYIPETKVLIEQKSLGIALDKKGLPSGGAELTPYEQAKRYNDNLPAPEKANWIVTSNFSEIWIYNMSSQKPEESIVKLNIIDLQTKYSELNFLVNPQTKAISQEVEISKKAGDEIKKIYDAILAQYHDAKTPSDQTLKSLNMLCVRLVFCFYAEDAGVFGPRNIFANYIRQTDSKNLRKAILDLFQILDQKETERDPYLEENLSVFPYVNGGLFTQQDNTIPQFNEEIKNLLLESGNFTWDKISPTIFGAIFESTLNQETRRHGGMHYTSIENIHKVIDPLFMNDLRQEFEQIKDIKIEKNRNAKLEEFQQKLGSLKFLDPACGSGNFLTESFMSIRHLENECIKLLIGKQKLMSHANPIKVDINQFYGIEINDFAVAVAKTALWIAESLMLKETENIVEQDFNFLPLTTYVNIAEGNALRLDWGCLVDSGQCLVDSGRGIVDSGQCLVGSKGGRNYSELQGTNSLAESDGISENNIYIGKEITKRGNIWSVGPNETGCDIDSVEHSGRTSKEFNEGVSSVYSDSERLESGIGNTININDTDRVFGNRRNSTSNEFNSRNWQNDYNFKEKTEVSTNHYTLPTKFDYIMGNPPFVGARLMNENQKDDLLSVFGKNWKNIGNLDYVCGWYKKASDLIQNTNIKCALVSTNSICQGETVANLWKPLFEDSNIKIDFAHRTFRWDSESNEKAHVHCVIVGFSFNMDCHADKSARNDDCCKDNIPVIASKAKQSTSSVIESEAKQSTSSVIESEAKQSTKFIYDGENKIEAKNINGYLIDAPNICVESRSKSICNVPPLLTGSQRIDDDNYMFTNEEKDEFVKKEPNSEKYFKIWYGADEFINNRPRWCLYLGNCSPSELLKMPNCLKIVEKVKEYRLSSKRVQTLKAAEYPQKFGLEVIPDSNFMIVPVVSSEKRKYIPLGFMSPDNLCSNQVNLIPNATLYHFGILTSCVHMAWMRSVCGRLKSDYRYSKDIVYNNFVWPDCHADKSARNDDYCKDKSTRNDSFIEKITQTAQAILDARAKYPDCSLADLYGENMYLFPALVKAHTANDNAVLEAYGFAKNITESEIVAQLFKLYEAKTKK